MLKYKGKPAKRLFDLSDGVYLRTGNVSKCALPVQEGIERFVRKWRRGDACWPAYEAAFEGAVRTFANLINAPAGSVCTLENTSMGISMAAQLIAPPPGSNVVVDDLTHPSNILPWSTRADVEVRYATSADGAVDPQAIAELVDERTAAVDVCHVSMAIGFRHDLDALAELAHAAGAYLVVDAAQSAGLVPIDVQASGVDFLACPSFKWLHGTLGAGFLYVKPGLSTLGPPPIPGWMAARDPQNFAIRDIMLHEDARRLQRGVNNGVGLVAVEEGMNMLMAVGPDRIWRHVSDLATQLHDGLVELGLAVRSPGNAAERAGIVTVAVEDTREAVVNLYHEGIHPGPYIPGELRLDIAFYHDREDIERTLAAFKKAVVNKRQRTGAARR
ncbi:MAG: aminotransferase class V-fold PLP-dependent enzyme [Alphaproteobacteria bacterium]|nr:aminotransferase class V-fold PLP-dependent enzyme [Alphaproteobacteria bacterium]